MAQDQNNETNILAPEAVLSILDTSLKPTEEGSNIILGSSQDALAALFHTIMQAVGFRLVGLGEEDNSSEFYLIFTVTAKLQLFILNFQYVLNK
jgi:hypothetical protein